MMLFFICPSCVNDIKCWMERKREQVLTDFNLMKIFLNAFQDIFSCSSRATRVATLIDFLRLANEND